MSAHLHQVNTPVVDAGKGASVTAILAEIPKPPTALSAREKKVWEYITQSLFECGLIHRTDGIVMTVICKTFVQWIDTTNELEKYKKKHEGSFMVKAQSGYEQPHQLYYVVRDLKADLLKWLPEAALTIPSFAKAQAAMPEDGRQQSLFDDPVDKFKRRRAAAGLRPVT